jgi:hypothetical protein
VAEPGIRARERSIPTIAPLEDDATQLEAARQIHAQARLSLYLILAREAKDVGGEVKAGTSLVLARAQRPDRFSTAEAQSSF